MPRRSLDRRLETLESGADVEPELPFDVDDIREGNYDEAHPAAPLSRKTCEHFAAVFPGERSAEEMHRESVERAIDRLENPEDYPDFNFHQYEPVELSPEEKDALDAAFGVEPDT